jgi:hypothetical protein
MAFGYPAATDPADDMIAPIKTYFDSFSGNDAVKEMIETPAILKFFRIPQ